MCLISTEVRNCGRPEAALSLYPILATLRRLLTSLTRVYALPSPVASSAALDQQYGDEPAGKPVPWTGHGSWRVRSNERTAGTDWLARQLKSVPLAAFPREGVCAVGDRLMLMEWGYGMDSR